MLTANIFAICIGLVNTTADELVGDPNLGQSFLRRSWQEVAQEPNATDSFKRSHFLIDLAEASWVDLLRPKSSNETSTPDSISKDIKVSAYQWRDGLAKAPHRFQFWISAVVQYWQNIFERPLDGIDEIFGWWDDLIPPLALSLILVLYLHLWIWSPALCKDLPHWFGSRHKILVLSFIFCSLLCAAVTGLWAELCFLLLWLTLIYSREKTPVLIGTAVVAAAFNLKPFFHILILSCSVFSAHEALEKGRTRLEYGSHALQRLPGLEKALWSDFNGDRTTAKLWLEKLPPSLSKSIVEINLTESSALPNELLVAYEELLKNNGEDSTILFNLSQLYIRTQKLVLADQTRNKIDPHFYAEASAKSTAMGRLLVPPSFSNRGNLIRTELSSQLQTMLEKLGLRPFNLAPAAETLLRFLTPWILIAWALRRRRFSSGLCQQTGEFSKSPDEPLSTLYLSISKKNERVRQGLRQQVDLLARRFGQLQLKQTNWFSWFCPGAASLILDQSLPLAFIKTFTSFLFLWNLLPIPLRANLLHNFQIETGSYFGPSNFSFGFAAVFLSLYTLFLVQNLSRSSS